MKKQIWLVALTICVGLTISLPYGAYGSGVLIAPDDHGCYGNGPATATFTETRFTYVSDGNCSLTHTRLNLDVTVHWTGVGTYDPRTGQAGEDIIVPAPRIDQPSRPYGRFQAAMHCSRDPWLNPNVKCDHISTNVNAPLDNTGPNAMGWKQPFPLTPIITGTIQQSGRPYTATMNQDAVNNLNRQYGAFEAQEKAAKLQRMFQPTPKLTPKLIIPRGVEGEEPTVPGPAPDSPQPNEGTKQ